MSYKYVQIVLISARKHIIIIINKKMDYAEVPTCNTSEDQPQPQHDPLGSAIHSLFTNIATIVQSQLQVNSHEDYIIKLCTVFITLLRVCLEWLSFNQAYRLMDVFF